jgi:hypothetical protein
VFEKTTVDSITMLKSLLKKQDLKIWIGLTWLTKEFSGAVVITVTGHRVPQEPRIFLVR